MWPSVLRFKDGWLTFRLVGKKYFLGEAVKKCSYARQSVVYVVENKCFPPSDDSSYGNNLCLGEEDYTS
jgi:hypothetical protein